MNTKSRFREEPNEPQNGFGTLPRTEHFVRTAPIPPPLRDEIRSFLPAIVSLPSEIVVPSIFRICSDREGKDGGYYAKPEKLCYGKTEIEVSGCRLSVQNEDVFIALIQLCLERGTLTFVDEFDNLMRQLIRRLDKSYTPETKVSIEKSLRQLTGSTIKIVSGPDEWYIGHLISFSGQKKDRVIISVDPFFGRIFAPFGQFSTTPVDVRFRLSLRGDVAKQLFVFFRRQKGPRYHIGLEKLCHLIGFDMDGRQPLKARRFLIKKALAELRDKKYLRTYGLEDDRVNAVINSQEHWRTKPERKERSKATEESVGEDQKPAATEVTESQVHGSDLLKYVEDQTGLKIRSQKDRSRARIKTLEVRAVGEAVGNRNLLCDFTTWLKEQHGSHEFNGGGWLKSISSGTLDPHKGVFARFMADMGFEMPPDEAIDRKFKLLTENEVQRRNRQENERKKAEAERAEREYEEEERTETLRWIFERIDGLTEDPPSCSKIEEVVSGLRRRHPETWREDRQRFGEVLEEKFREYEHRKARGQRSLPLSHLIGRLCEEVAESPT